MKQNKNNNRLQNFNFTPSTSRTNGGFTLVELMVSLSLFVIVVLALVGSLYNVNNASRKVTAMKSVLDNLNFALESMSRTIRTGSTLVCGGVLNGGYNSNGNPTGTYNCPISTPGQAPGARLLVASTLGIDAIVEYRWALNPANGTTGEIEKRTQDGSGVWSNWISLTAPEIDVQRLSFYVDGSDVSDNKQPGVIMFVQGVASAGADNTAPFSIQTYISQRAAE